MHDNEYCYEDDREFHEYEAYGLSQLSADDTQRFSVSEAAWQEAYNRVLAGGTTICAIYSRNDIYFLEWVKGCARLGYISEDRDGRIWQYTDSNDQRIELDPSRGGKGMYY